MLIARHLSQLMTLNTPHLPSLRRQWVTLGAGRFPVPERDSSGRDHVCGHLKEARSEMNPDFPHTQGITLLTISYVHAFPPHYPRLKTQVTNFIS